ncbi:MAG: tetratricopeptide repeat protein [Sideroxydans sp.]|nr:tetratricopeptide repeat protein [Sideroxydans sp.]
MSLLLDAMKKAGGKVRGHSENSSTPSQVASVTTDSASSPSRAASENLFSVKKKKPTPRIRWTLGLVPSTLLICSVIGTGYGYYVWREITPPEQPEIIAQPSPPPTPISTPEPAPLPQLVAAIPPAEHTLAAQAIAQEEPQEVSNKNVVPKNTPRETTKSRQRHLDNEKPNSNTNRGVPPRQPVSFRLQQDVDSLMPVLQDAYQAYQRGDYATAAQGYRNALKRDGSNRDALLGLGAIAQQQKQDQTAQHYFRQVLQLNPRDAVALGAMSAYNNSNETDTESQLKQSLSEQPRSSALNYALGNVYADQSRWAEAQQAYFNAHMIEPSNAQFTYNLAVSLDHLGQRKVAAQFYQQALQLDTSNNAGFNHAQVQQRLNELTPNP